MADCPPYYPTNPSEATTSLELFPILPADCPATPGGPSAVQVLNPPETETSLDNFLDSTADCPRPSGGPSAVQSCEPHQRHRLRNKFKLQLRTVRSPIADCPQSILLNLPRQHRLWTKLNLTGGLSAPPRRTVRDTQLLPRAAGGSKCGGDGGGRSLAPATHHGRGKRL